MSELNSGERQVAETLDGIRKDHVARYEWVAERVSGVVVDMGCGVGYGSAVLADAGCTVRAVDRSAEAIAYGREHYDRENITWAQGSVEHVQFPREADAIVAFEVLEHLPDPFPVLQQWARMAPKLFVSVPNEDVFPFRDYAFHQRHYRAGELEALLNDAGFEVKEWWGQAGQDSAPERRRNGRTLIAECEVAERPVRETWKTGVDPLPKVPERVAIIAMGESKNTWVALASMAGGWHALVDEVWAINSMASVIQHHRVFAMDDLAVQDIRAAARPDSSIAEAMKGLRGHPGPIYTPRAHPDYPGSVEYPLQDVLRGVGGLVFPVPYINNTVVYALLYAMHIGVKEVHIFGADYGYKDAFKREKGRACLEFWLGIATARGMKLVLPGDTTLMDTNAPEDERFYGYDAEVVTFDADATGKPVVTRKPRDILPTADEMERRYSHIPGVDERKAA